MFQASVYFTKEQLPGVTESDLASIFMNIIKTQEVNEISYDGGVIHYRSGNLIGPINKYAPFFARFPRAQIAIINEGDKFIVHFQAKAKWLLLIFGIGAIISILGFSLIWGFNMLTFSVPVFLYGFLTIANYLLFKIYTPRYFSKLHDKIIHEFLGRQVSLRSSM